jgi:hypothetical protein
MARLAIAIWKALKQKSSGGSSLPEGFSYLVDANGNRVLDANGNRIIVRGGS